MAAILETQRRSPLLIGITLLPIDRRVAILSVVRQSRYVQIRDAGFHPFQH